MKREEFIGFASTSLLKAMCEAYSAETVSAKQALVEGIWDIGVSAFDFGNVEDTAVLVNKAILKKYFRLNSETRRLEWIGE